MEKWYNFACFNKSQPTVVDMKYGRAKQSKIQVAQMSYISRCICKSNINRRKWKPEKKVHESFGMIDRTKRGELCSGVSERSNTEIIWFCKENVRRWISKEGTVHQSETTCVSFRE